MLVYNDDHGMYYNRVGTVLKAPIFDAIEWADPVVWALQFAVLDIGVFPTSRVLRAYSDVGDPTRDVLRSKPRMVEYDATIDAARYGSVLTGLGAAGRLIRGDKPLGFDPGVEHQTIHTSYRGDVSPVPNPTPLYHEGVGPSYTFNLRCSPAFGPYSPWQVQALVTADNTLSRRCKTVGGLLGSRGMDYTILPVDSGGTSEVPVTTVPRVLETLLANGANSPGGLVSLGFGYFGKSIRSQVNFLEFDSLTLPTRIRYTLSWGVGLFSLAYPYFGQAEYSWTMDCSINLRTRLRFSTPDHHHLTYDGGYMVSEPLHELGSIEIQHDRTLVELGGTLQGTPWGFRMDGLGVGYHDVVTYDHTYDLQFTSECSRNTGESILIPNFAGLGKSSILPDFSKAVEARIGDIRLSSFISSSNALDTLTNSLQTDVYQTLAKLGDIGAMLPEILLVWRAVRKLRGGRYAESVSDVISFLTRLRLQSSFQWKPSFDLLTEKIPEMQNVMSSIRRLEEKPGLSIGRGDFTYDFPLWEFGRYSTRLRTHTKAVVRVAGKPLMADLLGDRAIGLLPSPSVGWDLIPFSFVCNWFTGIGSRIRDLESNAFYIGLDPQVFVHSYQVTSRLTRDELVEFQLASSELGPLDPGPVVVEAPVASVYVRDVSSCIPPCRDGFYDFRLPGRSPDWMISGSLLWNIFHK